MAKQKSTIRDRIKSLRRVKSSQLAPNPRNWRTHPEAQAEALRGMLAEVGYAGAVLARETPDGLELIDGHLRAELDPDAKIPVLVLDVTEQEADKLLATFDPLGAAAEVDQQKLGELLAEIETESDGVQALLDELAAENGIDLFAEAETLDAEPQMDRAVELQEQWGTETGQLWVIPGKAGEHRLLCGDSTKAEDVGRLRCDARLLFTSPPYLSQRAYKGANLELSTILGFLDAAPSVGLVCVNLGIARKDGAIDRYWDQYIAKAEARGLKLVGWLVWNRRVPGSVGQQNAMFPICHEFVLAFATEPFDLVPTVPNDHSGETRWCTNRNVKGDMSQRKDVVIRSHRPIGTVIECAPVHDNKNHPAQFPAELPSKFIAAVPGNVYDPFLGSGTTMLAAEQLGRVCYGMEISPAYCAVILQRMTDAGLTPRKVD